MTHASRRYDLDWIRVLAFGLLILYHIGIGFVPWDVYAYENNDKSESLELVLLFIGQWRLPVLFLVSGMGTRFALSKRSTGQFVGERTRRLLIPLIFGANFIVVFHAYYAALYRGEADGFLPFALGWWSGGGQAQHLWFLLWLLGYTLVATPLLVYLRDRPDAAILRAARTVVGLPFGVGLLVLFALPLVAVEWIMKPSFPGPIVGYMIPWYFLFFVYGFLLVCVGQPFRDALARMRRNLPVLGTVLFILWLVWIVKAETSRPGFAALLINGGWVDAGDPHLDLETAGFSALHVINAWVWCLAVFAWGARYLDRPSRVLGYCNRAVYCFYITHFPFTMITLYYVKDWQVAWPSKFLLITVVTFFGCWAVFELASRTAVSRLLFGIKPLKPAVIGPPDEGGEDARLEPGTG